MRRCIVTLLVFALTLTLVLPGCGPKTPTDEGPIPINPDGTIGLLRWGMTCEEAEKADRRIVFNKDPNVPAGVCNVEFLGHQAGLALHFRSFPEEGDDAPERLWLIKVFFNLERGEPDYIPIVGAYFTETAEDGQSYGYGGWASTETLEDRISREKLEKLWPEGVENGQTAQPLWQAGAISTRGPADAGGIPARTGDREFSYNAVGNYQVLAEIFKGR